MIAELRRQLSTAMSRGPAAATKAPGAVAATGPTLTAEQIARKSPEELPRIVGSRVYGRGQVMSIKPAANKMFEVTAFEKKADASPLRLTEHYFKNRRTSVVFVLLAPEETALRLTAGLQRGSQLSITGTISGVKTKKDNGAVNYYLYLRDANAH